MPEHKPLTRSTEKRGLTCCGKCGEPIGPREARVRDGKLVHAECPPIVQCESCGGWGLSPPGPNGAPNTEDDLLGRCGDCHGRGRVLEPPDAP